MIIISSGLNLKTISWEVACVKVNHSANTFLVCQKSLVSERSTIDKLIAEYYPIHRRP